MAGLPFNTPAHETISVKHKTDNPNQRLATFEAIVSTYEGALLRYAHRLLQNRDTAQDVVQDTFIRLYRTWQDPFEPGPAIQTWLYRVAHNSAVDHVRRESRMESLHLKHAAEHAEETAPAPDQHLCAVGDEAERAARALETLSLRDRQLILLKVYEEKSYKEISAITGLSVSNVGYSLHHAMKKLAAALHESTPPPSP